VWLLAALIGFTVAVAVVGWLLFVRGNPQPVDATVFGYRHVSARGLLVTVQLHKPAGRAAACTVVSYDARHAEAGRATLTVGASAGKTTRASVLVTSHAEPISADVTGCRLLTSKG
jgi:hypothetical protein